MDIMESFVLSGSHLKTIIYTEKNKLKQSWTHHSLLSNMLIENLLYIKSESGWQLNNTTSWALQGSGTRPWALDRLIASTSPHPNSGLASFSRNKTYWTRPLYVTFFRPKAKKKNVVQKTITRRWSEVFVTQIVFTLSASWWLLLLVAGPRTLLWPSPNGFQLSELVRYLWVSGSHSICILHATWDKINVVKCLFFSCWSWFTKYKWSRKQLVISNSYFICIPYTICSSLNLI
jgi:hypothetical protein